MGHQNRFRLALMPLPPLCHVWGKVSSEGGGKGGGGQLGFFFIQR